MRVRGSGFTGRTEWVRGTAANLTRYLRTEQGSSAVLVFAIVAAVIWANVGAEGYHVTWDAPVGIAVADWHFALSAGEWVGQGLMTLFFFVVGLEARHAFDLGSLSDVRRTAPAVAAAVVGMLVGVAVFLSFTHNGPAASGWGAAMSSDTALVLGLLSIAARNVSERVREFLLALLITDDLVALIVLSTVYTNALHLPQLLVGVVLIGFLATSVARRMPGAVRVLLAVAAWFAVERSGVDAVVVGLVLGLTTPAFAPARAHMEQVSRTFKRFREQPNSSSARIAASTIHGVLSPNERLTGLLHPAVSYLIVPLFALANAGVAVDVGTLSRAFADPVTLGIITAYVVGKPFGVIVTTVLVRIISGGRLRAPAGWGSISVGGAATGIGFTVATLVATAAFTGSTLEHAKIGILTASLGAITMTAITSGGLALAPRALRPRLMIGPDGGAVELDPPVDPGVDHVRGSADAPVTIVEYGDFECPYCGLAESAVQNVIADHHVRFVWRHLPLDDVHPNAQLAAEAAEAADAQGRFWEMHDLLLASRHRLTVPDVVAHAQTLGLDIAQFESDLASRRFADRIARDVLSADTSTVAGTPTFFINGRRHYGAYDAASLLDAVNVALDRTRMNKEKGVRHAR